MTGVIKMELFFQWKAFERLYGGKTKYTKSLNWHQETTTPFNCQDRNTSCWDVRETSPQISSLTLHPPCSHWGNMLCLSKLTTSSLQQSQQTCMGTYLSKIEDSSYPLTMTNVSGSAQLVRIKMSCYMSCKSMKADDRVKWCDRATYRNRFGPGGEKICRHWTLGKALLLAVASCEEQRRAEVMSKHTGSSRAQKRGGLETHLLCLWSKLLRPSTPLTSAAHSVPD